MKYTPSHEWITEEQDALIVGITQYAQKELGEIVYVQLPSVGTFLQKGEEAAVLESTKAASDVYSPVAGEVIEKNTSLERDPKEINFSPEDLGWLFKLRKMDLSQEEGLLSQQEYDQMIRN
jgi:glycine cleavage system H protein